jgi:hypothetical protein
MLSGSWTTTLIDCVHKRTGVEMVTNKTGKHASVAGEEVDVIVVNVSAFAWESILGFVHRQFLSDLIQSEVVVQIADDMEIAVD